MPTKKIQISDGIGLNVHTDADVTKTNNIGPGSAGQLLKTSGGDNAELYWEDVTVAYGTSNPNNSDGKPAGSIYIKIIE